MFLAEKYFNSKEKFKIEDLESNSGDNIDSLLKNQVQPENDTFFHVDGYDPVKVNSMSSNKFLN